MSDEIKAEYGIQETKELFMAVNAITVMLVKSLKDGAQAADLAFIVAEMNKPEMQELLKKAMENVKMVPAEVKDINMAEAFELAPLMISEFKKILEAAKK